MERKRVAGRFVRETTEERAEREKKAAVGAPRAKHCRTFARNRMAEAMPELVDALVKRAKGGSVAHVKALVELSGLPKSGTEAPARPKRREKTFAAKLLEEIGEG